jgi:hypothetical protein
MTGAASCPLAAVKPKNSQVEANNIREKNRLERNLIFTLHLLGSFFYFADQVALKPNAQAYLFFFLSPGQLHPAHARSQPPGGFLTCVAI